MIGVKKYKLSDLINVKHGFAFKGEYFSEEPTNDILLSPGNFKIGGGFKADKFKYYKGAFPKDYILKEGDIIITMTDLSKAGDTLGYSAKIPPHKGVNYLHNQRLGLVQFKNDDIDPDFLYWILRTQPYQYYIVGSATGSTVKHTSPTRICTYEFEAPIDKSKQQEIAQILTSLDDKIELNHKMNQTLEAMAQALFKEWFVNFNFPGFDGELVDGLPKGWRMGKLSDIIEIKHGYAFKGEFFSDFEEKDVLITPGNFKIGGGFNSQKFKYYKGEIPHDYILKRNDLLVTMTDLSKGGDTLGYSALVPTIEGKRLLHNQRIGKVMFRSDLPVKHFLYWLMRQDDYRHFVLGGATGSTVKHTSPTRICEFEFPLPSKELLLKFETKTKSLTDKSQENEIQIQTLTQTRDTLLPKLMSGKIEIIK